MSKVLVIEQCTNCPFFKAEPLSLEDSYRAICQNPELSSFICWTVKIGRQVVPPPICPLPDKE